MQYKKNKVAAFFSDRFRSTWELLSETTNFLGGTREFHHYENQLRQWRLELQRSQNKPELIRRIREDISDLRKHLRLQGYDLSLAGQRLVFDGFRNDDCVAEGFRRMVLYLIGVDFYWQTGDDNHVTLDDFLERRLEKSLQGRKDSISGKHFLWYRRLKSELTLSGSATETAEDYERLKAIAGVNSLLFLSKLKGLR
jgi:hypothetical protein